MKKEKGITLVALVITIIILLILVGITFSLILGNNGILNKTREGVIKSEIARKQEQQDLELVSQKIEHKGIWPSGEWNSLKKVNEPDLASTGLIPIKFEENGNINELTDLGTEWFDYNTESDGSSKWANAVTKDDKGNITGFFVWIPRYEYQITNTVDTEGTGKVINIKFIPLSQTSPDEGYIIHPAFTDGTHNDFKNGEWDKEISGFWVAKFPAGYQANTITDNKGTLSTTLSNSGDTIIRSGKTYSYTKKTISIVDLSGYTTSTEMSWPVFKPLTYAYNQISIGDSYTLSREISKGTNFYGLTNTTDSHMLKNSEWGAVSYLTQSNYGRHGTEPNINNYYTNYGWNSPYRYLITGLYANGKTNSGTITLNNPYYNNIGVKGSSTGNITGVYDLNGCVFERTAGYITNGDGNLENGSTFVEKGSGNADSDGYKTLSKKYATVYPYNSNLSSDTSANNWTVYKNLSDSYSDKNFGYGDAILETSTTSTGNSWHGDYLNLANNTASFFRRGGHYGCKTNAGIFAVYSSNGTPVHNDGFRVVLIGN